MSADLGPDGTKIAILKHELKEWEKKFAADSGGRKPGRDDARDAIIAVKYKEYNRLQRQTASLNTTPQKGTRAGKRDGDSRALKERPANVPAATPKRSSKDKQSAILQVPTVVEEEPTPACVRFALGPTPQKDGEVLGIFDALPAGTPSQDAEVPHGEADIKISATPSKNVSSSSETKLSRTPQSSGRRFFLGVFEGTPMKRKREDEDCPSSTAKRLFATPSFLRRSFPLARIDEDAGEEGLTAPPFKRRGLVRSFSSIIQGLRKIEEEKMDDEWEILREIEKEESGDAAKSNPPKVLVEDSQPAEMPLGPDQGPEASDDDDAVDVDPGSLDANGNPRKAWKKRGQKRQTKRVKMRPVHHKVKKAAAAEPVEDDQNVDEVVEETEDLSEKAPISDDHVSDQESEDANDDGEESEFDGETEKPSVANHSKKSAKRKGAKSKPEEGSDDKKDRKPKKVSAQSHQNFRKLKIKNKNSKPNGRGGRFGRR